MCVCVCVCVCVCDTELSGRDHRGRVANGSIVLREQPLSASCVGIGRKDSEGIWSHSLFLVLGPSTNGLFLDSLCG